MALQLIRGTIDEVKQVVHIDWILPRYLSQSHIKVMVNKLGAWDDKMDQVIKMVENGAEELIVS
jgi:26S proteasome regulatory subunit N9